MADELASDTKTNTIIQCPKCIICFEIPKNPVSLSCGHTFCKHCQLDAAKKERKCVVCRQPYTSDPKINIELRELISALHPELYVSSVGTVSPTANIPRVSELLDAQFIESLDLNDIRVDNNLSDLCVDNDLSDTVSTNKTSTTRNVQQVQPVKSAKCCPRYTKRRCFELIDTILVIATGFLGIFGTIFLMTGLFAFSGTNWILIGLAIGCYGFCAIWILWMFFCCGFADCCAYGEA